MDKTIGLILVLFFLVLVFTLKNRYLRWLAVIAQYTVIALMDGFWKAAKIAGVAILLIVCYNLIWNYFNRVELNIKYKIINICQIAGFSLFFVSILVTKYFNVFYLITSGLALIFISILLRRALPVQEADTLEQKLKNELKVVSTTKKMKLPTKQIGGFVIPLLPFFSILNKNWKKKLNKEALIHETVHLHYLQNGLVIGFVLGGALLLTIVSNLFKVLQDNIFFKYGSIALLATLFFTWFEYITFNKTNEIGDKLKIKTRKWTKDICKTYLIVYAIQLVIIVTIVALIRWVIGKIF